MRVLKDVFICMLLAVVFSVGLTVIQHGHYFSFSEKLSFLSLSPVYSPSVAGAADIEELTDKASSAISKVEDSVVAVYGVSRVPAEQNFSQTDSGGESPWWLQGLRQPRMVQQMTAGSGFFVSTDGYILTNRHVVNDENATYSVVFSDGSAVDARVVYRDPDKDLALIKVESGDYAALTLGDSSRLEVGQTVMDMGNPFGHIRNAVSSGEVVSLNRSIKVSGEDRKNRLDNLIQTSTQLYPGDSGGPTFDLDGMVVGVNVAAAVDRNNVSFSIPINDAKEMIRNVTGDQIQ